MPALPIRGAVAQTLTPPIPKAQAWMASYLQTHPPGGHPDPNPNPSTSTSTSPQHQPLLNLSQGVPGEAPEKILTDLMSELVGARDSADYGGIRGDEGLRRAVGVEMKDIYRWDEDEDGVDVQVKDRGGKAVGGPGVDMERISISAGCNQAFYLIMSALCREGDEIIVPCPWYFNILMTLQLLKLHPIPLPLTPTTSFLPSLPLAESLITPQTRAIVLVSPNNPCGVVYPAELLKGFYELAKRKGVALVVDETYRDFVRPEMSLTSTSTTASTSEGKNQTACPTRGKPHDLFSLDDWDETLISLFSFSKSYKIPGYRLGGMVASRQVLEACRTVADCIQICPSRLPQLALAQLLPSLRPSLKTTSDALHARLAQFQSLIHLVPGWKVSSSGGYFSYVQFPDEYGPDVGSEQVARRLVEDCGVVVLPGAWFMPEKEDEAWVGLERMGCEVVRDRWLRFAIANVSSDVVDKIPERLLKLNALYGMKSD